MKSVSKFIVLVAWAILISACGGGGGGTSPVSAAPPPAPPPPAPPPPPPPPIADYTVLQLNPLPGHRRANANDINDNGQIVGWSGAENQIAVLWTIDGAGAVTVQDLGTLPGGTLSIAYGINNLGQIVGSSRGAPGSQRPFIWTADDGMRDLGVPEGLVGGSAQSINDAGQVVGAFLTSEANAGFEERGTFGIWIIDEAGNTIDELNFGTLGGTGAVAFDNNVHGNVAGDIWFGGSQTGFFWSEADGVVEIGTEEALGINDNDEVVGWMPDTLQGYVWTAAGGLTVIPAGVTMRINNSGQATGRTDGESVQQAYIWEAGEVKLLPLPENRDFSWGLSINEAGWIVGWSTDVDGTAYANLWIPN